MIIFYPIPIILIVALIAGVLGFDIAGILTWLLAIMLVISIIALIMSFVRDTPTLPILVLIAIEIVLLVVLDGKHFSLWDILF